MALRRRRISAAHRSMEQPDFYRSKTFAGTYPDPNFKL